MKKLFFLPTVILVVFLTSTYSFSENFPKNDTLPDGVMYKGVNEDQWKTIKKIGDPLDCQKKLYNFQQVKDFKVVSPQDCESDKNCIQNALIKNDKVRLLEGKYEILKTIFLDNKILIGAENGNTLIDAKNIPSKKGVNAIILTSSVIANLNIENSPDNGISLNSSSEGNYIAISKNKKDDLTKFKSKKSFSESEAKYDALQRCKLFYNPYGEKMQNACFVEKIQFKTSSDNNDGSLVYRVKIGNSGVDGESFSGKGVNIYGKNNRNHCLVSVEAYNGFNQTSTSLRKKSREKGGNADGFSIKHGPTNITLIDTHAHHNSDDGYDFWGAGNEDIWSSLGKTKKDPIIRIFYSSALKNGKHPIGINGDGQGFKLGANSGKKYKTKDYGARLIYGSASCLNKHRGFDKNVSKAKMILLGNDSKKNKKNYEKLSNKKVKDDKYLLKCSMFFN